MASDTRQKLVETAIDLIWQSSFGAVSVDDICKNAGVKKGSFYHFFPSKTALALAALDAHFDEHRPALDAAFSPSRPPLERFVALAALTLTKQEKAFEKYGLVCGCPFASLGCEIAGQQEMIRARTDEIYETYGRYCENALIEAQAQGAIPKDVDTGRLAEEIGTYFIGQMTMARIQNDLTNMKETLVDGLFRIIGTEVPKVK
ncbi:MAG: TetR/AcrR family transcriptional regulator [Alphaproteobacteria bacterium]|nr:TetR/AcrR family transcriptional regulator [Alphaproteobacteria bacterium]